MKKYNPRKKSGFHIEVSFHKAKTAKGKDRFYVHIYGSKSKKWKIIYSRMSKPSAWITFEQGD